MARTRAAMSRASNASAAAGSPQNPISIRDSNSPETISVPAPAKNHTARSKTANKKPMSAAAPRVAASRVTKTAAKPKAPIEVKECIICASTKRVGNSPGRGFRIIEGTCDHFQGICNTCVGKMLKGKILSDNLEEPVMVCAFPQCEYVLEYGAITQLVYKGARENFDQALLHYRLRKDENYMCCLNLDCGLYFSTEDCQIKDTKPKKTRQSMKSDGGNKIACPYCEFDMCMKCVRPYHANSCSEMKAAEEEMTLQAIKDMGAKPCPKCGVNIEKNGGCNHMKCKSCKHDFCFSCLVAYGVNMQHGPGCPDGRHIADDPANWVPDHHNGLLLEDEEPPRAAHPAAPGGILPQFRVFQALPMPGRVLEAPPPPQAAAIAQAAAIPQATARPPARGAHRPPPGFGFGLRAAWNLPREAPHGFNDPPGFNGPPPPNQGTGQAPVQQPLPRQETAQQRGRTGMNDHVNDNGPGNHHRSGPANAPANAPATVHVSAPANADARTNAHGNANTNAHGNSNTNANGNEHATNMFFGPPDVRFWGFRGPRDDPRHGTLNFFGDWM